MDPAGTKLCFSRGALQRLGVGQGFLLLRTSLSWQVEHGSGEANQKESATERAEGILHSLNNLNTRL